MDRAMGSLIGVAVGDAAGAPLEGRSIRPVTPSVALNYMHMPGKAWGRRRLGRGQTTDDTELTICLARGLAGHPPSQGFPTESTAEQYSYWYAAGHYSGGRTCKTAFCVADKTHTGRRDRGDDSAEEEEEEREQEGHGSDAASLATRMLARSQRLSMSSKANGALMRIAPIAVWGHQLDPATLAQHAAADARLSHPNPTCCDCSAAYAIAAAHLIRHPGDAEGAVQAACTWAEQHAGEEARQWLFHDSLLPLEQFNCHDMSGFVRHGFTLAFLHLRLRTPFADAIQQTLCMEGDTDTNAAIVGGLLGALHGAAAIPEWMKRPVLGYQGREDQGGGRPRPENLRAARLPGLALQLYQLAGS